MDRRARLLLISSWALRRPPSSVPYQHSPRSRWKRMREGRLMVNLEFPTLRQYAWLFGGVCGARLTKCCLRVETKRERVDFLRCRYRYLGRWERGLTTRKMLRDGAAKVPANVAYVLSSEGDGVKCCSERCSGPRYGTVIGVQVHRVREQLLSMLWIRFEGSANLCKDSLNGGLL